MPEGKIKKVVLEKGYGFIEPNEGGGDIFFHHSSCVETPIEELNAGQAVSFDTEPGQGGKGPRAVNVKPLD